MHSSDVRINQGVGAGLLFNSFGGLVSRGLGNVEPEVQTVLADLLGPGDVFYDVGANIGYFTIIGARLVGPSGRVVAVEPQPEALRRLRHNLALNGFDNVTVVEAAVADEESYADLVVSQEEILEEAALAGARAPDLPRIRVRMTTLDQLRAADLPAPTLVKLDIEGAEVRALNGMVETLRRDRPAIVCEVHTSFDDVCAPLEAEGYSVRQLDRRERTKAELLALVEERRFGGASNGDYGHILATPR
jgi:FkbM family methyltransferase